MYVVSKNGVLYSNGRALDRDMPLSDFKKIIETLKAAIEKYLNIHRGTYRIKAIPLGDSHEGIFTENGVKFLKDGGYKFATLTVKHLKPRYQPLWNTLVSAGFQPQIVSLSADSDEEPGGYWLVFK